jgi:hypothetical protein
MGYLSTWHAFLTPVRNGQRADIFAGLFDCTSEMGAVGEIREDNER